MTVKFDALTDDRQGGIARVERVLVISALDELNYSVSLLDRWPGHVSPFNLCPQSPAPGDLVFILGFPGARGLEISLHDNEVLAPPTQPALPNSDNLLFYTALTEHGSSGSPVFNADWELAAIQMGAVRVARANFGARMHAVMTDASRKLKGVVLEQDGALTYPISEIPSDRATPRTR